MSDTQDTITPPTSVATKRAGLVFPLSMGLLIVSSPGFA